MLFSSRSVVFNCATPWTAAHQASLSFIISRSLLTLMSVKSHPVLCLGFKRVVFSVHPSRGTDLSLGCCLRALLGHSIPPTPPGLCIPGENGHAGLWEDAPRPSRAGEATGCAPCPRAFLLTSQAHSFLDQLLSFPRVGDGFGGTAGRCASLACSPRNRLSAAQTHSSRVSLLQLTLFCRS